MGKRFKGVYDLRYDRTHLFSSQHGGRIAEGEIIQGIGNPRMDQVLGDQADELRGEMELVQVRVIRSISRPISPVAKPRSSSARRSTISVCASCSMPSSSTRRRRVRV
jgi:hypothetical protein